MESDDTDLLDRIYEGPSEEVPWQGFVDILRRALQARAVVLTLHHVEGECHDLYVMACAPGDTTDWDAVETMYRTEFMAEDPMRPGLMHPGQMVVTDFHFNDQRRRQFAEGLGIAHSLRTCCAEPGGTRCWLDVVRGREDGHRPFSSTDLNRIRMLTPHLTRALGFYARIKRQESERAIYEGMVEHFALGCLLLNEDGAVIHMNRTAAAALERWPGIRLSRGRLTLSDRTAQQVLDASITALADGVDRAAAAFGQCGTLIRLGLNQGRLLALLVYPAPRQKYFRGGNAPAVIIYLCDPRDALDVLHPAHSQSLDRISQLFGLTRQEAALSLRLGYGETIAEAAREMGIAETAARNYSKKIYAKMGIASQTDLVRLILRSLPFLR